MADRLSRIDTVPDRELSVLAWQRVGAVGSYSTAAALPDGWQITVADRKHAVLTSHRGTLLDAAASTEPRTAPGFARLVTALVGSLEAPIE
jgi:hypothetical protein